MLASEQRPSGLGHFGIPNPVVAVEVASTSDTRTDRLMTMTMREYPEVASIKRAVLVERVTPVLIS